MRTGDLLEGGGSPSERNGALRTLTEQARPDCSSRLADDLDLPSESSEGVGSRKLSVAALIEADAKDLPRSPMQDWPWRRH